MTMESSPDWRALFHDVQNETDKEKLKKKVDDLEAAIFFRFQDLQQKPDPAEVDELRKEAEAMLRIKDEKLGYPMDSSLFRGRIGG